MQTLLAIYTGNSILLILLALPLIARKIKPNPFYGFRVRQTLDNPDVWYDINQYFAKRLLMVGIFQGITSLTLYFVPNISVDAYTLSCLGVFVVLFSFAMFQSWRYMKSLK